MDGQELLVSKKKEWIDVVWHTSFLRFWDEAVAAKEIKFYFRFLLYSNFTIQNNATILRSKIMELEYCKWSIMLHCFYYFMLPRTGWVGVPKLRLSAGAGNMKYATTWSVVCSLQSTSTCSSWLHRLQLLRKAQGKCGDWGHHTSGKANSSNRAYSTRSSRSFSWIKYSRTAVTTKLFTSANKRWE